VHDEKDAGEKLLDRPAADDDATERATPVRRPRAVARPFSARKASSTQDSTVGAGAPGKPRAERRKPKPKRSRIRAFFLRTLETFAILAGLVATAALSAAIAFTMAVRTNEVTVPDLSGTSLDGAREQLRLSELQLILEGNRFDDTVPPDFIAMQAPSSGTTLKKGRSVRVWVSLGPSKRTVPRIEGETLQSAQLILEQAGFSLGRVVEIHSDVYAQDSVVAQSPQAYEEVGDETEVSVLLSRGYLDEAYVMPDFIGQDYVNLLDRLSRSALKVSQVRLVDYPGVAKNIVVRQVPAAGTKVYKRDRIILYLSRGS
jgi:beta-lactam-binding protein with PASTA domain